MARWLLMSALAEALERPRGPNDLEALADLLLEARALRGREAPAREREILLALSNEFERIAGEPMGNVVSRLGQPGDLAPRPASEPGGAEAMP
jgi:hypothetical protein